MLINDGDPTFLRNLNKKTMVVNHFLYNLKCFKLLFGFELDLIVLLFPLV
jgi:hypothetical protein